MISKRLFTRSLLGSAAALFAGVALMAQAPSGGQQPSTGGQQQQQQPPSATASPMDQSPATQQDYGAQAFVSKAIQGDEAEVQLGQLAQQKGSSADIKEFGQKMVSDHTQINDKLMVPVAKQIGASQPKGPSKKDKKEYQKLESLSGQQFDTAYIQMMVQDHQKDLKDYQEEAQSAQNPMVKQAAQEGATVIQKHLQLAEQLAKDHNVPVSGKEVSSLK